MKVIYRLVFLKKHLLCAYVESRLAIKLIFFLMLILSMFFIILIGGAAFIVPWYAIIFYSTGVVFFCAAFLTTLYYFVHQRTIFERLRYVDTEPFFINPNTEANTIGIHFKCKLMNMNATRSVYVSLRRAYAQLQGRTNPEPELQDVVSIVPPLNDFPLSIAAVPNVNISQEIKGKLELEIAYGPSPDYLPYSLIYEIEPRLTINNMTPSSAQFFFNGPLKKYLHKRK